MCPVSYTPLDVYKRQAFNRATGGLAQKGVYVIAARPGRGKTDFALQMAVMLAARWRVHYFSMEMTACQLARRVLSRVCGIQAEKLRDGTLSPGEREAAQQVAARFDELHLTVDEAAAVGMEQLEQAVAQMCIRDRPCAAAAPSRAESGTPRRRANSSTTVTLGVRWPFS